MTCVLIEQENQAMSSTEQRTERSISMQDKPLFPINSLTWMLTFRNFFTVQYIKINNSLIHVLNILLYYSIMIFLMN